MKKRIALISVVIVIVVAAALYVASQFGNLYRENAEMLSRLRMVETERNALSDAVRCYADDRDTTIMEYSRWYLEVMGCPKTLEDWGNIY